MAWNFKDEATIAQRQDDMFAKGVPYEESKQYAINNKMTYWNWKSVKMYTWWKTDNSNDTMNFKDWTEFKNMVNSIDTSNMSADDLKSLWEYIQRAKINWVTVSELWMSWDELEKASAKKIDSTVKNINNNSAYNQLMWYYDDEWYEDNMDIFNGILYSPSLSSKQKQEKLNELKWMVNKTMNDNVENAWDDLASIKEAAEKNKQAWKLWKKINNNMTQANVRRADYNWITDERVSEFEKEIVNIISSDKKDRRKKELLRNLEEKLRKKYLNNIWVEYSHLYWDWIFSANKWKELTPEQQAEKKMMEEWMDKWHKLQAKINAYIDWL